MLLHPGQVVATQGALKLGVDLQAYLLRHLSGDWGDLDQHDMYENDQSADLGYRVFSVYDTDKGKLWIITEADRSATTILRPSEY